MSADYNKRINFTFVYDALFLQYDLQLLRDGYPLNDTADFTVQEDPNNDQIYYYEITVNASTGGEYILRSEDRSGKSIGIVHSLEHVECGVCFHFDVVHIYICIHTLCFSSVQVSFNFTVIGKSHSCKYT